MKSKAYRAVDVKRVEVASWLEGREEKVVHVGLDVGKESVLCVVRWGLHDFDRPWRVGNPSEASLLASMLAEVALCEGRVLAGGQSLVPAMALRLARSACGQDHRLAPAALKCNGMWHVTFRRRGVESAA